MLDCIHFSVFLFFEKPHLDSFSIDSYPSRPLDCFSRQILTHFRSIKAFWNLSWLLLDKFSIHRETFFLHDSCSIHRGSFVVDRCLTAPRQIYLSSISAWQLLTPLQSIEIRVSIYSFSVISFSFLSDFSRHKLSLFSPKHFSLNPFTFPTWWYDLFSLIYNAFHTFRPRFLVFFFKIWGFSKLCYLWNFWVRLCLNDPICSCIASHLHFHNVSWILDVCFMCWNLVCW